MVGLANLASESTTSAILVADLATGAVLSCEGSIIADLVLHDVDPVLITLYVDQANSIQSNINDSFTIVGYLDQGVVNDLKIDQRTSIIGYIDQSISISTER